MGANVANTSPPNLPSPRRIARSVWAAAWLLFTLTALGTPSQAAQATHVATTNVAATNVATNVAASNVAATNVASTNVAAPSAPTAAVATAAVASGGATATASAAVGTGGTSAAPPQADETPRPPAWTVWKERVRQVWKGAVGLTFEEWPSPLFERHFWNTTLTGLRVATPLLAALLLLLLWVVDRGHGRLPSPALRSSARVFTIFGFLLFYGAFNPNVRHPGLWEPEDFYHSYLGTKYHSELERPEQDGSWLVDCTLTAEKELGKAQTFAQRQVFAQGQPELVLASSVPAVTDPQLCKEHFSPERWTAFRSDVQWFTGALQPDVWARVMRTRGEVMSPGLRLFAAPLVIPAASEGYFRALAWLGVVAHAVTLTLLEVSFGPLTAAIVSVTWGCQPFFPFSQGVGLLDGLPLLAWLWGLCAWRKRRPHLGGCALGIGVLAQPWTALGLVPWAVATWSPVARAWWAKDAERSMSKAPVKLGGALALGLTLLLGGVASARFGSYAAYQSELETRVARPQLDDVGLAAALNNHGSLRYRIQRNDAAPDPAADWSELRGKSALENRLVRGLLLALWTLALAALAWRRPPLWGAQLGLLLPPLLSQPITMSHGLIPLALLGARRTEWAVPVLTAVAGTALLHNQLVFTDDRAAAITGVLWVSTAVLACGLRTRRPLPAGRPPRREERNSPALPTTDLPS